MTDETAEMAVAFLTAVLIAVWVGAATEIVIWLATRFTGE
jgi:hypothetical protein